MKRFSEYKKERDFRELILESKQEIVNLGYPSILAKLFYRRFSNNAYLLAKWYRDYKTADPSENWFRWVHSNFSNLRSTSLADLVELHDGTESADKYVKALQRLNLTVEDISMYDSYYLAEQRKLLEAQIEDKMFSETFFNYYSLVNDIISDKLKDISPYKNFSFWDAQHKYDEKNIFSERLPIRTYKNGYKWIDVGRRCVLLGHLMKNCGSAGLMSMDDERTILALFDSSNKPHVMVTYSPNEKRISGDEGVASTEVKGKYHRYILDLANFLGVTFDVDKSKSKSLGIKYKLKGMVKDLKRIGGKGLFDEYYTFTVDSQVYYTNSYLVVSAEDMSKVREGLSSKKLSLRNKQRSLISMVFNNYNIEDLKHFGVNYMPISQFQQ